MGSTLWAESYFRSPKRTEMHEELYQYFIQHKQLNVPGIGTFLLERTAAVTDFPNKQLQPAAYSIALHHTTATPSKNFFAWLSAALHVSDREAVVQFNDFAFDLKKKISDGNKVEWNGMGVLSAGLAGETRFEPALRNASFQTAVHAEKITRENASHTVRVGEDEKTSEEMTELLSHGEKEKSNWWVMAIILALLSFLFIGWYLSEHGVNPQATGLGKKMPSATVTATYKQLP